MDRSRAESDVQSAEVTEAPQTTQAQSTHRRVRPLSQSRSYHSIFSSVRGSARNGASSRGRAREKPEEKVEEEEEEKTSPTTPAAEEEPVTVEAVEEEEPNNDVVYSEPQVTSTLAVTPTPMTTTLRAVTSAPTTAATTTRRPPPRRPVKIRVHQKPGSSSLSSSPSTDVSSSSSRASSSLLIPKHSQEASVMKKDGYTDSLKPESKFTFAQPSITQRKPSTTVSTQTTAQPKTVAPPSGRDPAGRSSGSVLNSRYGFGQRNSGIASRGNFTRYPNGYKYRPASTANAQSKLPGRTQSLASSNTDSSKSQSPLPTGSQNRETSGTLKSAISRSNSRTGSQSESTPNTEGSDAPRSRSHSPSTSGAHRPTLTSRSGSRAPTSSETHDSEASRPTARRVANSQATSHNTHPARTPEKQDMTYGEESHNTEQENAGGRNGEAEGQTSSVRLTVLNANVASPEDNRKESGEGQDGKEEKNVVSPARVQPSHTERSQSLASRFPGRFGTGARVPSNRQQGRAPWGRTSSSVGAGRPVLQGSVRRASGASGAAGVTRIQETSENVETASEHNLLKKGLRDSSHKPSTTVRKNEFSESRQPSTSTAAPSSPNSDSHHSSGGHRASSEAIHGEASPNHNNNNNNENDHEKDYLYKGSKVIVDRNEKVPDPTAAPKTTTSTPVHHHQTSVNRGGGDRREPSSGSRTSSSYQRPAVSANGRARSPTLANRQPGGYRLPFRVQPAQNTRARSPTTPDSSSLSESSSHSSSSKMPRPVLTSDRGEGRGSSVTRTGGLSGGSLPSSAAASYTPSSSSSSASARDSLRTRARYPNFRGKASTGEALRPNYGNGNIPFVSM